MQLRPASPNELSVSGTSDLADLCCMFRGSNNFYFKHGQYLIYCSPKHKKNFHLPISSVKSRVLKFINKCQSGTITPSTPLLFV